MKARFMKLADELIKNEELINEELLAVQDQSVDLGGYFHPDTKKATQAMRPSATLNKIIDKF